MRKLLTFILAFSLVGCGNQGAATSVPTTQTTNEPTVDFGDSQNHPTIEFSIDSSYGVDVSTYQPNFNEYHYLTADTSLIKGVTFEEALKLYGSSFTGLIFYGYPTCAFCNEALPVVAELSEQNQQGLYYVNVHMENYGPNEDTLKQFEDIAYNWYQDDGQGGKSFFVPTLFAVKEGEILDAHTGLLEGVTIDTTQPLSSEHHDQLATKYQALFDLVK